MLTNAIKNFFQSSSSGGVILFASALMALLACNSPLAGFYQHFFNIPIGLKIGNFRFEESTSWWINDVFMVFFFLMVCLEIKWEIVKGELNSLSKVMLPLIAALGGICLPAIIYLLVNAKNPTVYQGWAIPTATDIAFSLGVLSLLGSRAPLSLKVFLSAIAIFDDLGAIMIIAFFYTQKLSLIPLGLAGALIAALIAFNYFGVVRIKPYLAVGLLLWICLLKSGIHPTLAGAATALAIPTQSGDKNHPHPPVIHLSNRLHPWVTFLILPLFALANAGVSFSTGLSANDLINPLVLGIAAGLFLGKQLGIFSAAYLAVKLGICKLPENLRWPNLYGAALVCGIGFTMSLFIGALAFPGSNQEAYQPLIRSGVIAGSFISGLLGYLFLYFNLKSNR